MNYVLTLSRKKQDIILQTIKDFITFILTHYKCIV